MSVWTTKTQSRDREYIVLRHTLRGVNYIVGGVRFRDSYAVVEKGSKTYTMLKRIPVLKNAQEYPLTHLKSLNFITRVADIKQVYGQDVYIKFLAAEQEKSQAEELLKKLKLEAKEKEEREAREREIAEKERIESEIKKLKEQEAQSEKLAETVETVEEVTSVDSEELVKELEDKIPEISKCSFRTAAGNLCKFDSVDYSPSNYCKMHLLEDPKFEELGIEMPKFMTGKEKKKQRKVVANKLIALKKQGKF